MRYIGQFKSTNDKLYTIEIITKNNSTDTCEITLGETPLVVSQKSDELFAQMKLREATISIVSDKYYFDMYSSKAHDTKVIVTDESNEIVFSGYLTPNIYNQDYVKQYDEFEIQAVEGVATLDYFKYETDNKTIISFQDILDKCLKKCACYDYMVYPKNKAVNDNLLYLDELLISECNFFNDDEEQTPWTMKEVLEEMLKYLGLTLSVHGNTVYLLDYHYIKAGKTAYTKHDIKTKQNTEITINDSYTINKHSYRDSDTAISLSETFNKIGIDCNLYEVVDLIPDFFGENIVNVIGDGVSSKNYVENIENGYVYLDKVYANDKFIQQFYNIDGTTKHVDLHELKENSLEAIKTGIGTLLVKRDNYKQYQKPSKLEWENIIIIGTGTNGQKFDRLNDLSDFISKEVPLVEINPEYYSGLHSLTTFPVI